MFRVGDQIGPYSLLQKIGRGAFGEVWLAEEKTAISTHRVALKLPNEQDIDLEAIRQEAIVWESVKGHPNILPIIKADIVDDQIFIASEYAPDGSLSKWLRAQGGKAPTVESARTMIRGVLLGLGHLHSKGIVHRDLKPENILLQAETPRIADFGIARLVKADSSSTIATGTPAYMAPECFFGHRSEKTDLWAVGVILHLLLTGKQPFPQLDQVSVMNAIVNGNPDIEPSIDRGLQDIIGFALRKDPKVRYDTATQMLRDLEKIHSTTVSEPVRAWLPETSESTAEVETVVLPRQFESSSLANGTSPVGKPARTVGLVLGLIALVIVGTLAIFQFLVDSTSPQLASQSHDSNSNLAGSAPSTNLDSGINESNSSGIISSANTVQPTRTILVNDGYDALAGPHAVNHSDRVCATGRPPPTAHRPSTRSPMPRSGWRAKVAA